MLKIREYFTTIKLYALSKQHLIFAAFALGSYSAFEKATCLILLKTLLDFIHSESYHA